MKHKKRSIPVNQSGLGEILLTKLNLGWLGETVNTFIVDKISLDDIFKGRANIKLRITPLNDYNKQKAPYTHRQQHQRQIQKWKYKKRKFSFYTKKIYL